MRGNRCKIVVTHVTAPPRTISLPIRPAGRTKSAPPLSVVLLTDALYELTRLRTRYANVKELAAVWASIDAARLNVSRRARNVK